ncbi:MAG: ABC transporter permease [Clostridium sp.]
MTKKILVPLIVVLSILSLFIGAHNISFRDILDGNIDKINIFLISRVPRLIAIILSGVALSISGVIMQQISNNKFVSPSTAATMDSARLGALVSTLMFSSATLVTRMSLSFIFAIIGTVLFMQILKRVKLRSSIFIPLAGIMLGNVIGSLTDYFAYKYNLMQNVDAFLQGDFSLILKGNYEVIFLIIPLIIIAFLYANKFTVISMGEDMSHNLGVDYNKVIKIGVSIVALISATVVITVGNIPFVGLIIPNIVSIFKGDNLSQNIGVTALFGAVFLLICDIIGRIIIFPYEIPISMTVGVIGSVIFLYLVVRGNRNEG